MARQGSYNTMSQCLVTIYLKIPFCTLMSSFPISRVTKAVPLSTMSVIVFHALAESRSEGEIKFPAALFITT